MNRSKILFFIILSTLMVSYPALSKVVLLPLNEMVSNAELIIIGKVMSIEKTKKKHKEYGTEQRVTIEIEKTIKGNKAIKAIKEVAIYYFPSISVEPEFLLSERAIFFIKIWEGKYTLVQGYAGKVIIENDVVKPIYIRDEEKTQKLQIFIQKIKERIGTVVLNEKSDDTPQKPK